MKRKLPFECLIMDSEPVEVRNPFSGQSCILEPDAGSESIIKHSNGNLRFIITPQVNVVHILQYRHIIAHWSFLVNCS